MPLTPADTPATLGGAVNYLFNFLAAVAPIDIDENAGATPVSGASGALLKGERRTLVVPDGSWECARAVVRELRSRLARLGKPPAALPFVPLDDSKVKLHHSPLIEALKAGQGQGRISTLEACALFLREAGRPGSAAVLLDALGYVTFWLVPDHVRLRWAPSARVSCCPERAYT